MKKTPAKKIKPSKSVPVEVKAKDKKPAFVEAKERALSSLIEVDSKLSGSEKSRQIHRNPTTAELAQLAAALALRKDGPSFLRPYWDLIHGENDKAGKPIEPHPTTILAHESLALWEACENVLSEKIRHDAEHEWDFKDAERMELFEKGKTEALESFGPYPILFDRALEFIVGKETRKGQRNKRFSDFLEYRHELAGKPKRLMASAVRDRFDALKVSGFSMQDFKDVSETYPKWIEQLRAEQARSRGESGAAGRWPKKEAGTKKKQSKRTLDALTTRKKCSLRILPASLSICPLHPSIATLHLSIR